MKIKIILRDCDPSAAQDRTLPHTAYLIGYEDEGRVKYDIAVSSKKSDIFDHYWDNFRSVVSMKQSEGRVNPKLWSAK